MKRKKINLKKETIVSLDSSEMANIKGGLTYSLSTGWRCKLSQSLDAKNNYECGEEMAKMAETIK
ncbi:MAG: TIGR04149 family rSAM-modified RiPP [Chryseotalea sp.]|jgi:natural product precursor